MSYFQDQYYNNGSGDQREYDGGFANNPRVQGNNIPYSTQNLNTRGTPRGRADDNDSASITSSIYSQPSVSGGAPSSNMQYYQGQPFNSMEPRGQFIRNEPFHHEDDPPSPIAASTNTHNSAVGLTQQGYQNENNYIPDYLEENHYHDFPPNSQPKLEVYDDYNNNYQNDEPYDNRYQNYSPNSQPPLDVYNDFNNINDNYQKDEPYDNRYQQDPQSQFDVYHDFNNNHPKDETYDDEGTRNNTLTGNDAYAMNIDNVTSTGKSARHSATGDHFVVTPKKGRRCALCSRKICVITSFILLVLLAGGMFFVWPRIPKIEILPATPVGDAVITLNPVATQMDMELQIEFDNRENWLPFKFNSLNVDVYNSARLSSYNRPLTTSSKKGFLIPGRAKTKVSIPISIDYVGSQPNDPVIQDFISACTQPPEGETRGVLNLRLDFKMLIMGLDWVHKPKKTIPVAEFQCPFEVARPSPLDAPATTPDPASDPAAEPPKQPADPAAEPPKQPADPAAEPPKQPADPAVEPPKQPA